MSPDIISFYSWLPYREKCNPKNIIFKSDMMFVWNKKGVLLFYYSKNLLCKHYVWLQHLLFFFMPRSGILKLWQRPKLDNGLDLSLFHKEFLSGFAMNFKTIASAALWLKFETAMRMRRIKQTQTSYRFLLFSKF
jgi:hypothetical protein